MDQTQSTPQGLGRAIGGAVLFALPLFMTMEMWKLGATLTPFRMATLTFVAFLVLYLLTYRIGFEPTFNWLTTLREALAALAIGFLVSGLAMGLLGAFRSNSGPAAIFGQVLLLSIPASLGAALARAQFGLTRKEQASSGVGYKDELFQMGVGALFFSLNIAPTEDTVLISQLLNRWPIVLLFLTTVGAMHLFVYTVELKLKPSPSSSSSSFWGAFLRYTVPGYAIVLLISGFILWTFGRFDGVGLGSCLASVVTLSFPGAIGASTARLLL